MIGLLASAALAACVPLADADRFGDIRFEERLSRDDPRFTAVACDDDGCTGHDRSGVKYSTNGEWIQQKIVYGRGPVATFEDRLEPAAPESQVLMAAICVEDGGMWLSLDLTIPGQPVYGLYAPP